MKEFKRGRFLLLVGAMVAIFIVAFLALKSNLEYRNESERYTIGLEENPKVSLSWWGSDERHKYTMEGVSHFEETQGIDVSLRYGDWNGYAKRTKVWMESGTEADVMQINYAWIPEYSPDGNGFYDLNRLSEWIDLTQFTEEELSFGTRNGKLNALPIAMNTHVFYYNQDMLDHYGLSVPETWDDLFAMGEVVGKDGKCVLGMSKKQLLLFLAAYYEQKTGKQMFLPNGTFMPSQEELTDLLEVYRSMLDAHVLSPVDSFDRSKYMSGEILGTMCWISDSKIYSDGLAETGVSVTLATYPKMPGAKRSGWYIKPATMWAISAETEHPEAAAKLLNYLLNDPYMVHLQQTEKGVPVSAVAIETLSKEGLEDTNEYKATEAMHALSGEVEMIVPELENEAVIDAFKTDADEFLFDKQSAEECAAQIRADIIAATKGGN